MMKEIYKKICNAYCGVKNIKDDNISHNEKVAYKFLLDQLAEWTSDNRDYVDTDGGDNNEID